MSLSTSRGAGMRRRDLLKSGLMMGGAAFAPEAFPQRTTTAFSSGRAFWLDAMGKLADPVLKALSEGKLRATMPVQAHAGSEQSTTYLEAFARLLSGLAPWLESAPVGAQEAALHARYVELAQQSLRMGVDPRSADYLEFGADPQTLVDAGFLSLAVLRAPKALNATLEPTVRKQLAEGLRATRHILPGANNWILFAAAVEAALFSLGEDWDRMRVDYAIRQHMNWYLGDGRYGDGPHFHDDFYNAFVIHPFLVAVLEALSSQNRTWAEMLGTESKRAARYAQEQERVIAPDGTYPITGRSITYRCGAFHLLAEVALRRSLPAELTPEQVRCALAAVISKTLLAKGTYDAAGWLRIGVAGDQPSLGEPYISTGSLYLCATAFLPLGLASADRFWSGPDTAWTAQKVWAGIDFPADHAIDA